LAAVQPRDTSLARYARVIIPNKTIILERGMSSSGTSESRDYEVTYTYASFFAVGEMIRKRNIFEQVDIVDSSDAGHVTPLEDEILIYFYAPDRNAASWYYVSDKIKRTPLHFDHANSDPDAKSKYFIDSIEALTARK
jgi:hypothetical protein